MPQLLLDQVQPRLVPVTAEQVSIGRSASNTIVLDSPIVSRFHCRIESMVGGGSRIVDLGSSNGTYVNGRPISKAILEPYDQIVVGNQLVVFVGDHVEPTFALDRVRSMPFAWANRDFREADDHVPAYEQRNRATRIHEVQVDKQDDKQSHYQEVLLRVGLQAQELDCQADLCRLMNTILDEILSITGFDAGILLLRDEVVHGLQPVSGRQAGRSPLVAEEWTFSNFRAERSLCERLIIYERPASDSSKHTMCVPLEAPRRWTRKERRRKGQRRTFLGLYYLFGDTAGRVLEEEDAWMVDALSAQAASVIHSTRLQYQATTDTLTGLTNRLYMRQVFEDELARCETAGVLILDLDHFKLVNDLYGHSMGDEVLRRVAQRIRCQIRQDDYAARWGGEEFLIFLPEETLDGVLAVAAKIAAGISGRPIGEEQLHVTTSIGVAMYPEHGRTAEALVRCADEALYEAKNAGRDRIHTYVSGREDWAPQLTVLADDMSRGGNSERVGLADILWATTPPDPPR